MENSQPETIKLRYWRVCILSCLRAPASKEFRARTSFNSSNLFFLKVDCVTFFCCYLHDILTFSSNIPLKTLKNYAVTPVKLEYIRI